MKPIHFASAKLAFASCVLLSNAAALHAQSGNQPPTVPNVRFQYSSLERFGDWAGFYLGPAPDPTQSKHWQGIARHPNPASNIFYLTRNGENTAGARANLAVLKMASRDGFTGDRLRSNRLLFNTETQDTAPLSGDAIIRNIEYTTHNHAGGIQISGNVLAVPLEDPNGSNPTGKIIFYDITNAANPQLLPGALTSTHNFGVVAFTQLTDGRYLILATYGDNSTIEFYISQPNDLTSFTNAAPYDTLSGSSILNWPVCNNAGGVYCFQNVNFVHQSDGRIYLACTWNTSPAAPVINGIDASRLFELTSIDPPVLQFVDQHLFNCSANSTGSNGNFNAAAGFYVSPSGELLLYSTTHDNDGPSGSTSMSEFRNFRGTRNSTPATPCDAWVRLYADPSGWFSDDRGMTFDAVDRLQENYSDFRELDGSIPPGFSDQASSATFCLPVGTTARLWQNDSFGGKYLDLVGTGSTVFIADFSSINWTSGSGNPDDAITSLQFFNAPSAGLNVPRNAATPAVAHIFVTGGPCAMIRIDAGTYAENPRFDKQVQIRASGGLVTIGTNP